MRKLVLLVFFLIALATGASAQSFPTPYGYSLTLGPGGSDLLFERPQEGAPPTQLDGSGAVFYYHALNFQVDLSGIYTLETTAANLLDPGGEGNANDTFLVLYQGSFDPNNPLANVLEANDDGIDLLSRIQQPLSSGTNYVLVTTTFSATATGTVDAQISGPSGSHVILPTSAPEPGSLALLSLGAVGTILMRRAKRI